MVRPVLPTRWLRPTLPATLLLPLYLSACPASEAPPRRTPPGRMDPGASPGDARGTAARGQGGRSGHRASTAPIRELVEVEGNRFGVGLCVLRGTTARCGAVVSADPNHPPTFTVIPRPVKRLSQVRTLAPGGDHRCDLHTNGVVWCHGNNSRGQLGLGHLRTIRRRARVGQLANVISLSTGWRTTCAARRDGTAWCWGEAASGQAGDGGRICPEDNATCEAQRLHKSPHRVVGLTGVAQIYAAYGFACALKNDATLWCWGENDAGQLGDSTRRSTSTPRRVRGLTGVRQVALSTNRSCAVTRKGAVWCWPSPGKGSRRFLPRRISALTGVTAVAAGTDHVCAIAARGEVWCWGDNKQGQLGDSTQKARKRPVRAGSLTGATTLLGLTASTCAAKPNGTLWCWGAMGQRTGNKRQPILAPRRVRLIGK
jgi:alpha-tubulin suppressor-like RCC1 family protein